jgi:DNA-binding CsgD family transcriptional regulator|tara:strand:+ start:5496 stop:6626 length:1131 start_codon:yes stop_codon:yes gene_type:complete
MATRYVDRREVRADGDYSPAKSAGSECDDFDSVLDLLLKRCHAASGLVYVNNLLTQQISIVAADSINAADQGQLVSDAQRNLENDRGLRRRASDLIPTPFAYRETDAPGETALIVPLLRGHEVTVSALLTFKSALLDHSRHVETACELQPLLNSYAEMWLRLNRSIRMNAAFAASLDVSSVGIFLIGADRSVLYRNATADRLVDERDGLLLAHDKPIAPRLADSLRLSAALEHVLNQQLGVMEENEASFPAMMLPRENGAPLFCIIMGLNKTRQESGDPLILMIVVKPESNIADLMRPVCDVYGLSVVERELATRLVEGLSVDHAATAMNVQKETARGYLKQIFLKTDTHRQAELVHFFMRYVMRISDDVAPQFCF